MRLTAEQAGFYWLFITFALFVPLETAHQPYRGWQKPLIDKIIQKWNNNL
jgi:hypothetical protein